MFYKKKNIKFSYYFYYLIGTMYFYSLKKISIKFWPILVMLYVKSSIFLHVKCLHVVVQLYNGVASPCPSLMEEASIQLDPYILPKDYQFFYASYKPSQQIKPQLELTWSAMFLWQF